MSTKNLANCHKQILTNALTEEQFDIQTPNITQDTNIVV